MQTEPEPNLLLRLALSYRESVVTRLTEAEDAFAVGTIDEAQFGSTLHQLQSERKVSDAAIDRFRRLAQKRGESLRAELRACRYEQAHLPERVASRELTPAIANDRNRALAARIEDFRTKLRYAEASVLAKTAEELGGFIDLPFDQYAASIAAASAAAALPPPAPTGNPKRWELAVAIIGAAVCAVSLFLPWAVHGGNTVSLFSGGLARTLGEPSHYVALAWIGYGVMPWLAVVLLLRARGAALGWSVLGTGLVMLAGALTPMLLAGADRVHEGDILQLWSAVHLGPAIYAGSAILLIVIGAARVSPWEDSLAHALTVSLALAGTVAVLAGLFAVFLFFGPQTGSVQFSASLSEGGDTIRVVCRNEGRNAIYVAVPWPDEDAGALVAASSGPLYGVRVEVREAEETEFSPLPYSQNPWSLPQTPLLEGPTVEIPPGIGQVLILDLRQLSVVGADAQAIRLIFVRRNGAEVSRFEASLPTRYLSPTPETRVPVTVPRPNTTPLPKGKPEPKTKKETAPESVERATPPTGWFAFVGGVGDKVAIATWDGAGVSTGSRLLAAGDAIGEGWYLVSVDSSSGAIIVHHDPSGTQVDLPKGERMSFGNVSRRGDRLILPFREEGEEAPDLVVGRLMTVFADLEGLGVSHFLGPVGSVPLLETGLRDFRMGHEESVPRFPQPCPSRLGVFRNGIQLPLQPWQPLVDL